MEYQITYNRITFQFSSSLAIGEREIHTYHEILFCMDADATLFTEKSPQKVRGDVLFLIPKEQYHFFRIHDREKFTRLKISLPADVLEGLPCRGLLGQLQSIENIDGQILRLLKKLCGILTEGSGEKQGFYAYSYFLMLLTELDRSGLGGGELREKEQTGELAPILHYISAHLAEPLTIEQLARKMNLSPSGVAHTFKKSLGISVHRYITQRRLVLAQRLLLSGSKPSKIYLDCGFRDYSSFYKAYLLFFGYPPSSEGSG